MRLCFLANLALLLLLASVTIFAQKPELVVQTGHSNFVSAVAFSPDGKMLASGALYPNRTIQLWDVATGIELRSLAGHADNINALVFSPNGKILASAGGGADLASGDQTVRLWEVASGKLLDTLEGNYPLFSLDGKTLAYARERIKLWSITDHREEKTINGDYPLGFGSQGTTIIGLGDGKIKTWDVRTGAELHSLPGLAGDPQQIFWHHFVISRDGKLVGVTTDDPSTGHSVIKIWEVLTGRMQTIGGGGPIAFTPDSKGLACGTGLGDDGSIKLCDLASGQQVRTLIEATNRQGISMERLTAVGPSQLHGNPAFSPNGKIIATGIGYGGVGLWDTRTGKAMKALLGHAVTVPSLAFGHNGKLLATGSRGELWGNNAVRLWDLSNNGAMRALAGHGNSINSVSFGPDDNTLASGGDDQKVKLWNTATGVAEETLVRESNVNALAFSPDGKLLAAGRGGATGNPFNMGIQVTEYSEETNLIDIWDVSAGKLVLRRTLPAQRSVVHAVAFSPDGQVLLSGTGYSSMETTLWRLSTGEKILNTPGLGRAFSPDGRLLAVESDTDHSIELHDTLTGALVQPFKASRAPVAFSRDGKILAVAGENNSISIYEVVNGARLQVLEGQTNRIEALDFTPDGQVLASSAGARTKLWQVASGRELATLIALDQKDWLVVTSDGLFDGSPTAWNQILWRFSNNTFDHAPVEAFYNEFYHPGLLSEIMSGKRPKAPSDILQKDRRQIPVRVKTVEKIDAGATPLSRTVALEVEVEEAPAGVDISDRTKRWPASGAKDIRLFRNGMLVRLWRSEWGQRDGCKLQTHATAQSSRRSVCTASVPIVAGANNFAAYAFNQDNVKSSDATLTVTGAESLKRSGTLHILAIGISQYANRDYNLNYTTDDATSFASQLKVQQEKLAQYQSVETKTLLNESATKENILSELKKLAASVQPEDAVVVYFSGHGKASGDHFYLVPHDLGYSGSRDQLSGGGLRQILMHSISDLELEEAFRDIDAGQMFMIIDACNSGQALENKDEPRRGPMNTRGLAQLAYEKGMYIMAASQSVEEAFVSEKLKHSYLTYALVEEGLKTKAADADRNGEVVLREWFDYALARVPKLREETLQSKSLVEETPAVRAVRSQKSQTPRVFYRREPDARPLIVAKVGASK